MKPAHVLIVYTLFSHLAFCGARMLAPLNAIALGAGPGMIGAMMAMFGLLTMLGSVHVGRWLDRRGVVAPLFLSALLLSAAMLLPALWQGLPALFLLCLANGFLWNVCYLATVQVLGHGGSAADKLGNFAMHSALMSVTSFIGPLLAGVLIDHAGFVATACVLALFPLVPLAAQLLGRLPIPAGARTGRALPAVPAAPDATAPAGATARSAADVTDNRADGAVGASAPSPRPFRTIDLIGMPGMRSAYYLGMVTQGVWNLYQFFLPPHAAALGMSATRIGIVLGCFAIASVVTRLACEPMARRHPPWQIMKYCAFASGIGLLLVTLFDQFVAHMLIALLLGGALGLAMPLSLVIVHEAAPAGRAGEAVGLRITLLAVIQTVGPALVGVTGMAAGFGPVFAILAGFAFAGWQVARQRGARPGRRSHP